MALTAPTNKLTAQAVQDSFDQLLYLDNAAGMASNTLKIISTENSKSCLSISENHLLLKGVDSDNAALLQVSKGTDGASLLTIDASTPLISTGVNDLGVDVKFFGATSGKYMLWDESQNTLAISGQIDFNAQGSGENISGNGTDLTLASGNDIDLNATADVNIPVNVGLRFGDGAQHIETDNTDLTITSDVSINLSTPQVDLLVDTNFVTTGGVNGMSIDGTTFSVDGANNRVGIGTATPSKQFQVEGSSGGVISINTSASATSGYCGRLVFGNDGTDVVLADINAVQDGATDAAKLEFRTEATGENIGLRMVIKSDGKVGIGETAPNTLLEVNGAISIGDGSSGAQRGLAQMYTDSGTSQKCVAYSSDSSDVDIRICTDLSNQDQENDEGMYVIDGGNVGIGTAAPVSEVSGTVLHIAGTGGNQGIINITGGAAADDSSAGQIQWSLFANKNLRMAAISSAQQGTSDGGAGDDAGGSLQFYTAVDNGALTQAMHIDESQNVGIGTATPRADLDVHVSTQAVIATSSTRDTSGDTIGMIQWFGENDAGADTIYAQFLGQIADASNTSEDGRLFFSTMKNNSLTYQLLLNETGVLQPYVDDGQDLGADGKQFDDVWYSGAINGSDARIKENIETTPLGLNFINKLHPVQFKKKDKDIEFTSELAEPAHPAKDAVLDGEGNIIEKAVEAEPAKDAVTYTERKTYKRKHHGLIAQEVKSVMDELGVDTNDFAGYVDANISGDVDKLFLRYTEFIAPMIKAIQELSAKVEALENA